MTSLLYVKERAENGLTELEYVKLARIPGLSPREKNVFFFVFGSRL